MLALLDLFQDVGDGGDRRLDVFERRFFEPNAFERLRDCAEDPAQSRIEGERSEERLRLDQLIHVPAQVVGAEKQGAFAGEEFAAVRPADVADDVGARGQRLGQRVRRLVCRFWRRRVDDRDDQVGPLREEVVELDLLLAPGERTRQELAAIGVDGDVARDIAAGEDPSDEKGGNDDPRMTGRQPHDPRDRGNEGGAVLDH